MMLAVYMILTSAHKWEFLTVDSMGSAYCHLLASEVDKPFKFTPGNVRIICVDDLRVQA
jgi:hypothetical protein